MPPGPAGPSLLRWARAGGEGGGPVPPVVVLVLVLLHGRAGATHHHAHSFTAAAAVAAAANHRPVQSRCSSGRSRGVPRRGRSRAPARSDSHAASALHCTAWHDWVPGPPLSPRTALCLNARPSLPPSHSSQSLPAARQPPAPPVLSPSLSGSPPLPLVRR
jgi:hypothetical protein